MSGEVFTKMVYRNQCGEVDAHSGGHAAEHSSALWQWEPDMIRFMNDASRYGRYDAEVAAELLPYISSYDSVCDAGCGLAYLSMALSPHTGAVTAVDINANVLRAVEENCRKRNIRNLRTYCGDAAALPPDWQFDVMLFCFFGRIDEIVRIAAQHCRKHVFIIKRNYTTHRFSVGRHAMSGDNYEETCAWLDSAGISYESRTLSLEMGQPFESLVDARRFFELYSKDGDPSLITDAFLSERLTETGQEDFPLYLPQSREIGLFHMDADSIVRYTES